MTNSYSNLPILNTKQHFQILDGLRGVAAISVVIFHFMEIAIPDYHDDFIAHAYLAVDFFFCLSGFVIAYAYDNRIKTLGVIQFLKLRLIRLHPLVLIGAIIGLAAFILDPFINLFEKYGYLQTFLMFLSGSFLIPYAIVPERYFNLFHLNPPTWSLFWEYIANICYGLLFFKIRNKVLWLLTIIASFLLCYEAYHSKYLGVGWSGDTFAGGGIRVFYSFLAGMLVFRSKWIIKSKLGFTALGILLIAAFLFPFSEKINFVTDPFLVIFYFPLILALGAGAMVNTYTQTVCKFFGEISYPLYMVHYPFIWIFYSYVIKMKPGMTEMALITVIGLPLLLGFAYLVLKFVDVPIRRKLTDKMKKNMLAA
ncbi:MAG: acyltransferase [Bacteroidota bacterium]